MRIIRFLDDRGDPGFGVRTSSAEALAIEGDLFGDYRVTHRKIAVAEVLAPIQPTAILGIGLNYRRHAAETGAEIPEWPVMFMKLPAAVQHPGRPILLPRHLRSDQVDYEGELAVVIGRRARNVRREEALDYVLGYTCANDVSARDWQKSWGGGQWCRGKSFDTFCPLGPCLATRESIPDPQRLRLRTVLNGRVVQDCSTGDMIFDVPALIAFLSGSTTLEPGTVILTGTPSGVGMARQPPLWLAAGDSVSIEIEGIGTLTNPVQAEPLPASAR